MGGIQGSFPENLSEAHKHQICTQLLGMHKPWRPKYSYQEEQESCLLWSECLCAKEHGDPTQTPLITILDGGTFSHTPLGTLGPKSSAQETPIQKHLTP